MWPKVWWLFAQICEVITTIILVLMALFFVLTALDGRVYGAELGDRTRWVLTVEIMEVGLYGNILRSQITRETMINEDHCKKVRDGYLKLYREKGQQVIARCTPYEGTRI